MIAAAIAGCALAGTSAGVEAWLGAGACGDAGASFFGVGAAAFEMRAGVASGFAVMVSDVAARGGADGALKSCAMEPIFMSNP